MQVFWVSGSVGKIHRINLRLKHLLLVIGGIVVTLIFVGVFLQYMGFQMAIEYNPQLARKLGNLHTAVELENLNQYYRQKLTDIEKQVSIYQASVNEMHLSNQKLIALATPPIIEKDRPKAPSIGGPFINVLRSENQSSMINMLQESLRDMGRANDHMSGLSNYWSKQVAWLESKPIGAPMLHPISISSGFGRRLDPFKNSWSEHLGVDFQAPHGVPIVASGPGIVSKTEQNSIYGNLIVIEHADGYQTRYAHASEILVAVGQELKRGQIIGRVGSTGRATGPHLHYELLKNGKMINPMEMLISERSTY